MIEKILIKIVYKRTRHFYYLLNKKALNHEGFNNYREL